MMHRFKTGVLGTLAVLIMGACLFAIQKQLDRGRELRFADRSPVFLPNGSVLRAASLGYRGLVADWLWIRAVLYYGRRMMDEDNPYYIYGMNSGELERLNAEQEQRDSTFGAVSGSSAGVRGEGESLPEDLHHLLYQRTESGLVEYIYPLLDRVTTVDPHFVFPYIFGGVYVLLDTGDKERAIGLLEKGKKYNPGRWEFPFYLGWIQWMYEGDLETTLQYLTQAVGKPGCPDFADRLLTGFTRSTGQSDLTLDYLEGMIQSTANPEIRERLKNLLNQIRSQDS